MSLHLRLLRTAALSTTLALALAGCQQSDGDRCQLDSDCSSNHCVIPTGGSASVGGTCQEPSTGTAATPDLTMTGAPDLTATATPDLTTGASPDLAAPGDAGAPPDLAADAALAPVDAAIVVDLAASGG